MLASCCSLWIVYGVLFRVCWLMVDGCLLFAVCCLLFVVRCLLLVLCCEGLLIGVWFAVCYYVMVWSVVCCLMIDV